MNLFRYCDGTDRHFRLIVTAGKESQPAAESAYLHSLDEIANNDWR